MTDEQKQQTIDVQKQEELFEAGAFTIGGMAGGGVLLGIAGKVGLAVGGVTMSVGLLPIVAVGAVTGLALYGGKKAFKSSGLQDKYTEALNTLMPSNSEGKTEENEAAKK